MLEYLKLSFRSLKSNKVRTFLTMLGLIIGVGAVITLTSIVGGLELTIKEQFEKFGANSLYIFPGDGSAGPATAGVNRFRYEYADAIENIAGVESVSPIAFTIGNVKYRNNESKGVSISGVEETMLQISGIGLQSGSFLTRSDVSGSRMVVVLGETVRENLFGNINPIGKEIKAKNKTLKVVGVLEEQGALFGQDQDNEIYIPVTTLRKQFDAEKPNMFFVKIDQEHSIRLAQRNIERTLERYMNDDDFTVRSQEQSIEFIGNILSILSTALGGIAAISLLVGGVGIMNIMFVSVTERTREIGLRKAVGADSKSILTQFLMEAVIMSLIGGLLGVLFGLGLSALIGNFIDTAPDLFYILLSFGVSALIGITFGIAPAIKASKMDPIVALRYE